MTARKILIFGKAGQLGSELCRAFTEAGWQVTGCARAETDVTDAAAVEARIESIRPDVVANAAAYNLVDIAEREPAAAFSGNALAVRNLAVACAKTKAKLIHYSTDYVFDGRKGSAYTEEDAPHPISSYGVSKLAGEQYANAYLDDALIIRTCGVFGPQGIRTTRGNFVELMLRLAAGDKPIRVVDDFIASPTFAPAMADRTVQMVEAGLGGVFHIGGGQPISWHDYAAMIFSAMGLTPDLQRTNEHEYPTAAKRPKYSALSNAKMERNGIPPMPTLAEAVKAYIHERERLLSQ